MKKQHFYRSMACTLMLLFAATCMVQAQSFKETFSYAFPVNQDVLVKLYSYDSDTRIITGDFSEVKLELIVEAEGKEKEMEVLKEELKSLQFEASRNRVDLNTKFWSNRNTVSFGIGALTRTNMKLNSGEKLVLSKFKMNVKVYMPLEANLDLDTKYADVEMDDLNGDLDLYMYDGELYAKNIGGELTVETKYSDMEIQKCGDATLDFYDSDLEADEMGSVNVTSKYSKFLIGRVKKLENDGYDDHFEIDHAGDLRISTKYTKFKGDEAGDLHLDVYDCDFEIGIMKDFTGKSKYSGFRFRQTGSITFSESFDDKITTERNTGFSCAEAKYTEFYLGSTYGKISLTGYDDKLQADIEGEGFQGVTIQEKYGDISLSIPQTLDHWLILQGKYHNPDFNESDYQVRIKIKESSEMDYQLLRGTEKEGMPRIEITGYDNTIHIR